MGFANVLKTDHKPLIHIFKCGRGLDGSVTPRISRWLLSVMEYNFVVEYVTADCLSRMPVEDDSCMEIMEDQVVCVDGEFAIREEEWKEGVENDTCGTHCRLLEGS